jgi:small-conductance mechanosensitive channel
MLLDILRILAVALGAHLAVLLLRRAGRALASAGSASPVKVQTLTGFATSVGVFAVYFLATGFVLQELGVSLAAYLASASVLGLAVSFGSQGLVQDVITGLTLVLSDLLDVGDLVEIGGQTGVVESIGIRFTEIVTFTGAHVFIPNRTVTSVVNYRQGFVRVFLDVRLPPEPERARQAAERIAALARDAHEQFSGIFLAAPTILGERTTSLGTAYVRVKFRVWPGQGTIVETTLRQAAADAMKELVPGYADWMVSVHYRAEPDGTGKSLPTPGVLRRGRTQNRRADPASS